MSKAESIVEAYIELRDNPDPVAREMLDFMPKTEVTGEEVEEMYEILKKELNEDYEIMNKHAERTDRRKS